MGETAASTSFTALIADDEPLVRERIRGLLAEHPRIAVLAECGDGVETLDAIRERRPDIVFLDIQMPALTGFQVLGALAPTEIPQIVFITAHDRYAIQAFDVNAVDYVLKPIQPPRFARAVQRALERLSRRDAHDATGLRALKEYVQQRERRLERFVVRERNTHRFVSVADVDWIEGAANYMTLHAAGREHLVRGTLTAAEARLDPRRFLRVHRSFIVNITRVMSVESLGRGEYLLRLPNDGRLRTSRRYSGVVRTI
jgi:two-component system LytT family response regulator